MSTTSETQELSAPIDSEDDLKLSWERFGQASIEMGEQISQSGYKPDIILAIARGGMFLSGSLGYILSVKNLYLINVEYYTGVDERLDVPIVLPPYLELTNLEESKILVTDDVADTGHTLELVKEFCEGKVAEARTAVLYKKPGSVSSPDFVWKHVEGWIQFPWSSGLTPQI